MDSDYQKLCFESHHVLVFAFATHKAERYTILINS